MAVDVICKKGLFTFETKPNKTQTHHVITEFGSIKLRLNFTDI